MDGDELVRTVFKDFFLKHGMEYKFGLSMLHHHFDLSAREMLVDYDSTSVPWPEGSIRGMKRPQPTVWAYSPTGQFRPTEFRYSEEDDLAMGESELHSIDSFKDMINQYNAADLFSCAGTPEMTLVACTRSRKAGPTSTSSQMMFATFLLPPTSCLLCMTGC